jgi:LytS/YehU family sensor histidine kinase
MSSTEELSESVSRLVELSKQIGEAKSDIKILVQAEKALKERVKGHMVHQGIDTINLKKGKIAIRKTTTKKHLLDGLVEYFQGDQAKVDTIVESIQSKLGTTESTSISLTGIKEKSSN